MTATDSRRDEQATTQLVLWALILFVVVIALTPSCPSAADPPLLLTTAIDRALTHHPSIHAADAVVNESQAAVGESVAPRFPTLSLSGIATHYQEPMLVLPLHRLSLTPLPRFDRTLIQGGLGLDYMLFDGGMRGAKIGRARSLRSAGQAARESVREALIARVVAAYLDVLGKGAILNAHVHRLAALSSELDRVRKRLDVGRAAHVEVLRMAGAMANARADSVRASALLQLAQHELARLIGSDQGETGSGQLVETQLTETTVEPRELLLQAGRQFNPDLLRSQEQSAATEAARNIARGARWPALRVVGNYLERGDDGGGFKGEWNTGLLFSYPLFTGGAIHSAVSRADAAADLARQQVRLDELRLEQEVDKVLVARSEAEARIAALTSAVEQFTEVARIQSLLLESGSGTQTDYLNAEAELLTARANLTEARHALIAAHVELARLTGALTPEWVALHLEQSP